MKIANIIFAGTPEFAVPALHLLAENNFQPEIVITQPDKPQGRKKKITPPVIKIEAEKLAIPVWQPENINDPDIYDRLKKIKPDLIITAAYGGFISRKLRQLPRLAAINIHPSLLPLYRGASPINAALWHGDNITGVTIFRLIAKMDAGPILQQSIYKIKDDDCYTKLLDKLAVQGAEDLLKLISDYENNCLKEYPQNDAKATYCRKMEKKDFVINWNRPAREIYHQVRALAEKPGAVTTFREQPIKIIAVKKTELTSNKPPGTVLDIIKNTGIIVAAKNDSVILEKVQPAGKKIMLAYDFHLGARIQPGELIGNF